MANVAQVAGQSGAGVDVGKVRPRKGGGCYHFNCVCGAAIVSANKVGVCWDCKREYRYEPGISEVVNPKPGRCPQCDRELHDDKCPKCGKYWFLHRGDSPWEQFWKTKVGRLPTTTEKRERMARYV